MPVLDGMPVLVLGATGMVGRGVVKALLRRGASVRGLARSDEAADKVLRLGAVPVRGSLQDLSWGQAVTDSAAVVHCARDMAADMGDLETNLMAWLLPQLKGKTMLSTGSCWVFGEGHLKEDMPCISGTGLGLDWLIYGCREVLAAEHVRGMVVHPGCVYYRDPHTGILGGTLQRYSNEAATGQIGLIKSPHVHTPWVHEDDMGDLYACVLERGEAGRSFNCTSFIGTNGSAACAAAVSALGADASVKLVALSDADAQERYPKVCAVGYAMDITGMDCSHGISLGWRAAHTKF